jgi:ectoine hydroxylase-related dioxygenase (phytanoyl-CoA dioxygenase family)
MAIDGRAIERDGFAIAEDVIDGDIIAELRGAIPTGRHGVRHLLRDAPAALRLAESAAIRVLVEAVIGERARVVRGLFFDKTPGANWKVGWHQDLTITVEGKHEEPGFGPWSVREGVAHVRPPQAVLESILALRIHLDDCGPENGPLRVIPGSHRDGLLDVDATSSSRARTSETICPVRAGGVMLMRPLLLHASSPAERPGHRRVIHLEYSAMELPGRLRWATT